MDNRDKIAFSFMSISIILFSTNIVIFGYNEFKSDEITIIDKESFSRFTIRTEGYHFLILNLLDDSYIDRLREYFLVNLKNLTLDKTYLLEFSSSEYFYTPPFIWFENGSMWGRDDFYLSAECVCWYLFVLMEVNSTISEYLRQNIKLLDFLLINNTNL